MNFQLRVRVSLVLQNKSGGITVGVYSPWTREVAGSSPALQTKCSVSIMVSTLDFLSSYMSSILIQSTIAPLIQLEEISVLNTVQSWFESKEEYKVCSNGGMVYTLV